MRAACKIIVALFAVAFVFALGVLAIGTFGLFGQERDPLSAVFLVLLGLPWNRFLDDLPGTLKPWFAALAPGVNLLLLWLICRIASRRFN